MDCSAFDWSIIFINLGLVAVNCALVGSNLFLMRRLRRQQNITPSRHGHWDPPKAPPPPP